MRKLYILLFILTIILPLTAENQIDMDLQTAINIAMDNSFRTKELELEIQRNIYWLRARQASLNTQVYMRLRSPDIKQISDYRWNSDLRRDEIVQINSQLWQSDVSVQQPLILFGYPTNGYLSLNYRIYRYSQLEEGSRNYDLYNRLYLKFEQPFFLPNELKLDLEEAQLNLRDTKLDYIQERVEIIEDISYDFYRLFSLIYQNSIHQNHLEWLQKVFEIAQDSGRDIEITQVELEITNVREKLLSNKSRLRQEKSDFRQSLRLNETDSLKLSPEFNLVPIQIDREQALDLAFQNNPSLERLDIRKRRSEIDVEDQRGKNAFHMSMEMTYGLEKKNHQLDQLWHQFDNSNSITVNAYVPIWDGGGRKNRIQAEKTDVRRRDLEIEEERIDIRKDVDNAYRNVKEYYERALNMQQSMELSEKMTEQTIPQYKNGELPLQNLLQIVERNADTKDNYLDIYLDYRYALLRLTTETYFNFEKNILLAKEFSLDFEE